jgi:hypothetical protein
MTRTDGGRYASFARQHHGGGRTTRVLDFKDRAGRTEVRIEPLPPDFELKLTGPRRPPGAIGAAWCRTAGRTRGGRWHWILPDGGLVPDGRPDFPLYLDLALELGLELPSA